MATSGSYNYTTTRNDLIEQALRKIGALGDHTAVASDTNKLNVGIAAINPVLRTMSTYGMPLWAMTTASVAFTNFTTNAPVTWGPSMTISTGTAGAGYRPLKVINAVRRDSTTATAEVDTPMIVGSYTDYMNMSGKESATGTPVMVFHNPLLANSTLNVWPLPDANAIANMTMQLWVQKEFQDFDAGTDNPDFPTEWTEAFIYALAYHLAPNYGLPPSDRGQLRNDRDQLIAQLNGWGVEEGSFRLQPTVKRWR